GRDPPGPPGQAGRVKERRPSADDEALVALVDEDVGDDGRPPRPVAAALGLVAGGQPLQFLAPLGRGEQGLELLLTIVAGLRLAHGSPSSRGERASYLPGPPAPTALRALSRGPTPGLVRKHCRVRAVRLRLAEDEVHDPAAADVRPRPAAVVEEGGVGAAGDFQGVGEDGEALEGTFVIDALGQGDDGGREPALIDYSRSHDIAEQVS